MPYYPPKSQIFGTKTTKCRRYGITILYRGTQKQAAEVAAISKYFSGSNDRTLEAINPKSAATLSTIAATFCIIIIENIHITQIIPKKIHILFIFLELMTGFVSLTQYLCSEFLISH